MFKFLTEDKKEIINNYIKNTILPNLIYSEFVKLIDFLQILIEYIVLRFNINELEYDNFWQHLLQNNYRDIIGIFNLLLPYIDDKNGSFELHKQITYIKDISLLKDDKIKDKSINNYVISNIQFNLYTDKEEELTIEHIENNFKLLLETIDRISNKLFVNWLNIRPYTINNYKDTLLYKNSIKLITHNNNNINLFGNNISLHKYIYVPFDRESDGDENSLIQNYIYYDESADETKYIFNKDKLFKSYGISIGDIFNTLYYDLFLDVVEIKWLIYQNTFDNPNNDEIYIKKFNEYIAIDSLYYNKRWNELNDEESNKFINRWLSYFEKIMTLKKDSSYYYLLLDIVIFMEKYYDKMNDIVKKYEYQKITKDIFFNDIDDDYKIEDDRYNITKSELISRIQKIPIEYIYEYFLETIQKFITTWYGRQIIKINKDNIEFNYDTYFKEDNQYIDRQNFTNQTKSIDVKMGLPFINLNLTFPENLTVKYKFIYNFAKTYTMIFIKNRSYINNIWFNSTIKERIKFIENLNKTYIDLRNDDLINPISFKKYYDRTYNKISDNNNLFIYIGNYMFQFIKDKLIDIVFECHIYKGLLSELVFDKRLTDKEFLGNNYETIQKNRFNNLKSYVFTNENIELYKKYAYYFLTDSSYGSLTDIHINKKKSYFDIICSQYTWYSFYSMDWISQINLFHRFINNRVLLITGATGQGKSTQVPKLLLYGLKMIDKKYDGKIICSQPRIKPTEENSERISWELGVPIFETSSNNKNEKLNTLNPYVQYKTEQKYHIIENHYKLLLKTVTDALLMNELFNYPIFKDIQKSIINDNISSDTEYNIYKKNNLYDIIIVDESHEHNQNMDIILTIARDTIKYNNSLRLVIVSATMLDDEPIYRRYFKEIDDNFTYPYNLFNAELNIDRLYIDRRIHISPPGETTQFVVSEIYLNYEPDNYLIAEEEAIKKVLQLCSSNTSNNILLFSLSKNDIKRICNKINSELPYTSKYICLPIYRDIPSKWENAYKDVHKITINRIDIFDNIELSKNIPKTVPQGTYTNFILVATNIAEASLTIDNLNIVIDTGYYYNVTFNYLKNISEPFQEKISESSRIQRKGRVGRVNIGTVFYMYTKDSRKNIKSNYSICQNDIYDLLYKLSANKYDEEYIIPTLDWLNLISKHIFNDNIEQNIKDSYPNIFKTKIFTNLINEQYTIFGSVMPSVINLIALNNYPDITYESLYDKKFNFNINNTYHKISKRSIRKMSGYDIKECIFDIHGQFYIIHPDENKFKRNILTGDLIDNFYKSDKIYNLIEKCFNFNLFINTNIQINNYSIFKNTDISNWSYITFDYNKSIYGRILNNFIKLYRISSDDSINRSFFNTIIYSYTCDVHYIIIIMIILLNQFKFKISNLNSNYSVFKQLYKDDDLYIFYSLAKKIYNEIKKITLNDNIEYTKINFSNNKILFLNEINNIKSNIKNNDNYWNLNIDIKLYKQFIHQYNQDKLDINKNIYDYTKNISLSEDIYNKFNNFLISLSINTNINLSSNIFKEINNIFNEFNKITNIYNIDKDYDKLLWFKYNLSIDKLYDEYINVKRAFIYGFGMNQTIIYVKGHFYDINTIEQYKLSNDTLTTISELMIFLSKNRNDISILINSTIEDVSKCNIYNYNPLNKINANFNIPKNILSKLLDIFNKIYTNRHKYLSFIKTDFYNHKTFDKLFKNANNFSEFIIRLFNIELNNEQFGGYNIIKFKISKIPYFCKKYNISISKFKKILYLLSNNYYIITDNKYIKIYYKKNI